MESKEFVCEIDKKKFSSVKELHAHLKTLKVKQSDYYQSIFARKDWFSGELIQFKSREQYFATDFTGRDTMQCWFKTNPDLGIEYSKKLLKKRKEEKELVYPPSEAELRSIMIPSAHYYVKTFGSYNKVCEELGFKIRFTNELDKIVYPELPKNAVLICDTREQKELDIDMPVVDQKLDVGDYGLAGKHDKKIYIERKSLNDFVGTLSGGFDRFEREIKRAKDDGAYLVLLIEAGIEQALGFNSLPSMRFTKTNPAHIFKNLRDLLHKYDNIQALFVTDRKVAAKMVVKLLSLGEDVKNIDLQFRFEKKEL
jgi:hypothetical protein